MCYSIRIPKAISIVIPIYNKQDIASELISRIKYVTSSHFENYEVIFVNDGSTDNTLDVLKYEKKCDSHIDIISYKTNRGKGYAVKRGIMKSRGDIIVWIDGDLDISPDGIRDYVEQLQRYDLTIASKQHPGSRINIPMSRRFTSRIFNLMIRISFGLKFKDTQAGLKAGRADIIKKIFNLISIEGYAFDVELLLIASILRLRIVEMPVDMCYAHSMKIKHMMRILFDAIKIWYRHIIKRYYQKQLDIVGE